MLVVGEEVSEIGFHGFDAMPIKEEVLEMNKAVIDEWERVVSEIKGVQMGMMLEKKEILIAL